MSLAFLRHIPLIDFICHQGYSLNDLRRDFLAGLTVSIVAIPLSVALSIASGVTPDRGIFTAIIASFVMSLFGGSRFQISGPTGAFVVVIFQIIQQFGYPGLALATLMAGIFLIIFGCIGLGKIIRYIPYPVIVGFTAGIGVFIFTKQFKDFFGLSLEANPAEFLPTLVSYLKSFQTFSGPSIGIGLMTILLSLGLQKFRPKWPDLLIAVVISGALTAVFNLPIATVGKIFGQMPASLPAPSLPRLDWSIVIELIPSAFTIALLGGIESLLSASIADSMTGTRHESNAELISQGLGNIACILFGGIPATGGLSRTATNIRSGAHTQLSGVFHALFILSFMLFLSPLTSYIPLTSLAGLLIISSVQILKWKQILALCHGPRGDRFVFGVTFFLTLLTNLTVAVEVGMVLALFFFTWRMIQFSEKRVRRHFLEPKGLEKSLVLPENTKIFYLEGPFFFGVTSTVEELLMSLPKWPQHLILDMRNVPFIDATGLQVLKIFMEKAKHHRTNVLYVTRKKGVIRLLEKAHLGRVALYDSLEAAVFAITPQQAPLPPPQ